MEKLTRVVEPRSWDEFRKTGLFMFVNTIIHAFGWTLCVEVESTSKEVTKCYPARTKYRGFSEEDREEMHERIAEYLSDTAKNFPEEIK